MPSVEGDEVEIPCRALDPAVASLTDLLGFRLDAIFPADAPREALVSGHGLRLRLVCEGAALADLQRPVMADVRVELSRYAGPSSFKVGRAGMQYRDLVPSRFGGTFIASHIRIPAGGPVPDYVHHHEVDYQLIYCVAGWVEVVYEDQGPPFTLRPGDCVLQPPGIRHRVLTCSDMLEVLEVGGPAEHVTRVDHDLELPTAVIDPSRDFGGQRFVRHRGSEVPWASAESLGLPGFEQHRAGLGEASHGRVELTRLRAEASGDARPLFVQLRDEAALYFVLSGNLSVDIVSTGDETEEELARNDLTAGDAITLAPGVRHGLSLAQGTVELVRVTARLR